LKIAVTGSTGFIGSALVVHLAGRSHDVLALNRTNMFEADLSGVDAVIHCAGLAHRSGRVVPDFDEFNAVNNILTQNLAFRARSFGVKRFVFVSTINVVAGNASPLSADMPLKPLSDYGRSKGAAEQFLLGMGGVEVVIARPSLVYGPGAPGNFRKLTSMLRRPVSLPFGKACNKRSFLSITNAVRALEFLAAAPAGKVSGRIFHLAEPVPLSTAEIVTQCRQAMGRSGKLINMPRSLVKLVFMALGRQEAYQQLFGDLEVDTSPLIAAGFEYDGSLTDLHAMARDSR
jgi:UDP-glucose 4-epimerase